MARVLPQERPPFSGRGTSTTTGRKRVLSLGAIAGDAAVASTGEAEPPTDKGRSAIERVAHYFLELGQRLQLLGLACETKFECPLNQFLLADALGLNAIHVNRVLRQLREKGLITVGEHHVVIDDVRGLIKLAGFDSFRLDQPRPSSGL